MFADQHGEGCLCAGDKAWRFVDRPALPDAISYPPAFYWYLCASNAALRLMWIYKLSPHLRHNHATVMLFTLAEGFRRFQWMFVRTEVGPQD